MGKDLKPSQAFHAILGVHRDKTRDGPSVHTRGPCSKGSRSGMSPDRFARPGSERTDEARIGASGDPISPACIRGTGSGDYRCRLGPQRRHAGPPELVVPPRRGPMEEITTLAKETCEGWRATIRRRLAACSPAQGMAARKDARHYSHWRGCVRVMHWCGRDFLSGFKGNQHIRRRDQRNFAWKSTSSGTIGMFRSDRPAVVTSLACRAEPGLRGNTSRAGNPDANHWQRSVRGILSHSAREPRARSAAHALNRPVTGQPQPLDPGGKPRRPGPALGAWRESRVALAPWQL